jgi:NAD(P)-dependent dehydrogenase (short-subunit alcohol dehydrogenase family)
VQSFFVRRVFQKSVEMSEVDGKVASVIGGSGGLGVAAAKLLAERRQCAARREENLGHTGLEVGLR